MNGVDAPRHSLGWCRHLPHEPATSEVHVVAGLDDVPEMRDVLDLFEGASTGALLSATEWPSPITPSGPLFAPVRRRRARHLSEAVLDAPLKSDFECTRVECVEEI